MGKGAQLGRPGEVGGGVTEGAPELLTGDNWGFDFEWSSEEFLDGFAVAGLNGLADLG